MKRNDGRPELVVIDGGDHGLPLQTMEFEAVERITAGWREKRVGSDRNKAQTFERDLGRVYDFIRHCHKPPWRWTEEDFDKWNLYLVEDRDVARSTHRTYQGAIRNFLDYCVRSAAVGVMVRERFGAAIRQICTEDNCITHKTEDEDENRLPAISREKFEEWEERISLEIHRAKKHGAKSYWPLMRDKAMFATQYICALRIGELVGNDLYRWHDNPEFPDFGRYGRVEVLGKGGKWRSIPVDNPDLPPCLEWYVTHVRPHFLRNASPNEEAMFLSERGTRLSRGGAIARCNYSLELIDMKSIGYSSHDWRRTGLTHGSDNTSLETQREKAGHRYVSTTAGYIRAPDGLANKETGRIVRRMLKKFDDPTEDKESEDSDDK